MTTSEQQSLYDAVGGHETFVRIVDRFYAGVANDSELRSVYPDDDLGPAAERLLLFLEQYWGGPTTYSDIRGHPRLGMRHAPFAVTPSARDAWLRHMRTALEESGMSQPHVEEFWQYVVRAAHFLVNTPDEGEAGVEPPASGNPARRAIPLTGPGPAA